MNLLGKIIYKSKGGRGWHISYGAVIGGQYLVMHLGMKREQMVRGLRGEKLKEKKGGGRRRTRLVGNREISLPKGCCL